MNTSNFKIYKMSNELSTSKHIMISAGKGKKMDSTVYIDLIGFSYIEGLFWDKYREYGSSRKIKISSEDIKRIVDGIRIAENKLTASKPEEVSSILKFELYAPSYPINDIFDVIVDFKGFLNEFADCMLGFAQKDKYVLINRNDA